MKNSLTYLNRTKEGDMVGIGGINDRMIEKTQYEQQRTKKR